MSNKVVSISGCEVSSGTPNPELVKSIEEMLERARSGEISGAVLCELYADRSASFEIVGIVGGYSLLGAVDAAKLRLADIVLGDF